MNIITLNIAMIIAVIAIGFITGFLITFYLSNKKLNKSINSYFNNYTFKPGDKVTYVPLHGEPEHGIVKVINEDIPDHVFVVFNCAGQWENYEHYTSQQVDTVFLIHGWVANKLKR